jgi:hypothetical protein
VPLLVHDQVARVVLGDAVLSRLAAEDEREDHVAPGRLLAPADEEPAVLLDAVRGQKFCRQ